MTSWVHPIVAALGMVATFGLMIWAGTVPLGIDNPAGDLAWVALSFVVAGYAYYQIAAWEMAQDEIEAERERQSN